MNKKGVQHGSARWSESFFTVSISLLFSMRMHNSWLPTCMSAFRNTGFLSCHGIHNEEVWIPRLLNWLDNYYYPNRSHLQFKMHLCDSHSCPEAVVIENCKNTNCITVWNRKYTENIVWKWAVQTSHPESFLRFVLFQTFPFTPHRHILQNGSIMWLIMRFLCVSFIIHVPVSIEHHSMRQNHS